MKSAEDWIREFSEITPLTYKAVEYVRQIQEDAYKQGVADAADKSSTLKPSGWVSHEPTPALSNEVKRIQRMSSSPLADAVNRIRKAE